MIKKLFSLKALAVAVLMLAASINDAVSQSWTVGVPVSMNLSTLGHGVGGCYPTADYKFKFSGSKVTGVNHYAVAVALPANSVYVMPGNDTLVAGDSILLPSNLNTIEVFCFSGSGFCTFEFYAAGTPTTAGQLHPCAANTFWQSNLLLCDESLTNNLPFTCTVLPGSTSIEENLLDAFNISWPGVQNNFLLNIENPQNISSVLVTGMKGEKIDFSNVQTSNTFTVNCDELISGVYFLNIITKDNKSLSKKFFLNK